MLTSTAVELAADSSAFGQRELSSVHALIDVPCVCICIKDRRELSLERIFPVVRIFFEG